MAEVKINLDNPVVQSYLTGDLSGLGNMVGKVLNAVLKKKAMNLSVQTDTSEWKTEKLI